MASYLFLNQTATASRNDHYLTAFAADMEVVVRQDTVQVVHQSFSQRLARAVGAVVRRLPEAVTPASAAPLARLRPVKAMTFVGRTHPPTVTIRFPWESVTRTWFEREETRPDLFTSAQKFDLHFDSPYEFKGLLGCFVLSVHSDGEDALVMLSADALDPKP